MPKNVESAFRDLGRSHGRLPQNAFKVVTRLDNTLMVCASALLRGFTSNQMDGRAVYQRVLKPVSLFHMPGAETGLLHVPRDATIGPIKAGAAQQLSAPNLVDKVQLLRKPLQNKVSFIP